MIGYTTFSDEQGGDGLLYQNLAEATLACQRRNEAGEHCQVYKVGADHYLYHPEYGLFGLEVGKNDFFPVRFVPLHLQMDSSGERK